MKYAKIFFLIIFILELTSFIFLLVPAASYAAEAKFTPQVSIGEFQKDGGPYTVEKSGRTIWNYIMAIYKYAIGVVGIVAAVVLMVGGIMWLTAGGNQTRISTAKDYITASLTGLLLALTSFLILATVNPRLTQFNPLKVPPVTGMGCCEKPKSGGGCSATVTQGDCENGWGGQNYICSTDNKCIQQGEGQVTSNSKCCIEDSSFPKFCKNIPSGTTCDAGLFPQEAQGKIFYISSGNKKCNTFTNPYGQVGYECIDK